QRLDHRRHQLVFALGPLVRVRVGPEGDQLPLPAWLPQLRREHLWDIDLDDDLTLEVPAGIQVQVGVGVAGGAVNARVPASPERVDRPIERQVVARHLVEGGLGSDLVEIDAERLGRVEGPDSLDVQPGQAPPLLPLDLLSIPAHRLSSLAPSGSRVERMFAYGKAV